jgi:3-hydroxyacyl-[acyl-carrier-protein] dehydratase
MKLLDNFYKIEQKTENASGLEYRIALQKEHFIYQAHFPGNPITPGVCIIQFCKELMEVHTGETFSLRKIHNVKFLSVIDPRICESVQVAFPKITKEEDGYKCSALVYSETTQFAKLSFTISHELHEFTLIYS